MVILFGLIIVAFFVQYDVLKTFVLDKVPLKNLILFMVIGLVLFVTFILLYLYSKVKFIKKLKIKISGLKEGILSIFHMQKMVVFRTHYFYLVHLYLYVLHRVIGYF